MAKPLVRFPDAVFVTILYLRDRIKVPVYSRVPESRPPEFIRVERVGGVRSSLVTDRPRISVECWSDSEENAEALMSLARTHMLAIAGRHGDTTVYRVSEVSGPMWLPDATSGQPRYAFAVEFSVRALPMI